MSLVTYVACEITGKQTPLDETVILDGKRVSAEGKAILLERMKSGGNEDLQLCPGVGLRFGAMFIDSLVVGVPIMVVTMSLAIILGVLNLKNAKPEEFIRQIAIGTQVIGLAGVVVGMAYMILMHGFKGQTLGKMACGIKVVANEDLASLTMRQSFLRSLFYQGPGLLAAVASVLVVLLMSDDGSTKSGMSQIITSLISFIPGVYILISIILALTDSSKQRTIHDRLGKTRVVRVSALKQLQTPVQTQI